MKISVILIWLVIVFSKWAGDSLIVFLDTECREDGVVELLVEKLLVLLGIHPHMEPPWWTPLLSIQPPMEPPWWTPLCSVQYKQECLDLTVLLLTTITYLHALNAPKSLGKKRTKHAYINRTTIRKISTGIKQNTGLKIRPARLAIRPAPSPKLAEQNNNHCRAMIRYSTRIDGRIFVEHVKTKAEQLYHSILLGPIGKLFEGVRIVLANTFKALGVSESTLVWSSRHDRYGNPEFLSVCSPDIRVEVMLIPGQGINMEVQRQGRARGRLREVTYWCYQVTYRGVVCTDTGTNIL